MKKIILSVVFVFLGFNSALAEDCSEGKFDRDFPGIEKYLSERKFQTIECFLKSIPEDIRAFRTFAKKSLSLQSASLMNPRAIIADPKGKLVLTFNGEKSQKGYDEVEMLAVDKNNDPSKWQASSIRIIDGELKIAHNEAKCSKCHGQKIRPIWEEYPVWPTFYGSLDDFMPDPKDPGKGSHRFGDYDTYKEDFSSDIGEDGNYRLTPEKVNAAVKEREAYLKFRDYAKTHPRYSVLESASDESNPVYPYTENYRTRDYTKRHNLLIGGSLFINQSYILFKRIKKNEVYQNLKNTLSYINECISFSDPTLEGEGLIKRIGGDTSTADKFHNIYKSIGIEFTDLVTRFISQPGVVDPLGSTSSGFTSISSLLNRLILQDNKITSPHLYIPGIYDTDRYNTMINSKYLGKDFVIFHNKMHIYPQFRIELYPGEEENEFNKKEVELAKKICVALRIESDEELKKMSYKKSEEIKSSSKLRKDECAACHDSGENSVASRIPFNDPSQWSEERRQSLWNSITYMTKSDLKPAHEGGLRMPLGGRPMTDKELEALKNYILKIE